MRWFLCLFLTVPSAYAGSITPRFTTGQMESSSRSVSTIQETIVTENYRTGFSYTVQGHNIKTDSYISPDATYTTSQNTGNGAVNFQWVTPELTSKPQWTIVTRRFRLFSLVENFLAPGLDAVSVINRTQTIETQSNLLKYLFSIGLLFTSPVYASNTISSSPSASSHLERLSIMATRR